MSDQIEVLRPIRRDVTVDVGPQRAFDIFVDDMASWWPADHHIGAAPIEEIVVEHHPGGRWYTRHKDGAETSTGKVRTFDRPNRVVLTWQIGSDWTYHEDLVTTLEITFEADGPDRTRVSLEHRGLEAYGEDAATMRSVFDAPGAWTSTLADFAAAATAVRS